jgi:hypothetical protein
MAANINMANIASQMPEVVIPVWEYAFPDPWSGEGVPPGCQTSGL